MPKQRVQNGKFKGRPISRNHRIGNRKSGTAAHQMSNEDLIQNAQRPSGLKKNRTKALIILRKRGVNVNEL